MLLICALPSEKHTDKAVEILKKKIDWDYFIKKAFENRIFPQTYERLNLILNDHPELKQIVPKLANLKDAYHQLIVANLILRHEARKAVKALARSEIIYTPFKGFLLDMLIYPENVTRDFVDIDLLFPDEKERMKAEKILRELGFEKTSHPHSVYHTIMEKRQFNVNVTIELHSSLPGITHLYQYPIIEEFWDTLTEREIEEIPFLVMPPEHMLLILALHAFREGYIKLKDLSDMVAIIHSTPEFNWSEIMEYANKTAWNYILSIPLHAYAGLKQILNEEGSKELRAIKKRFPQQFYKKSYPISYATICNSLQCDRKCKKCLFLIQKEIPGFPDPLSRDYFIKYFPSRLKLSSHFLVTYVRKDYGVKYALKCYINMAKALIQMSKYILGSIIRS